MFGQMTYGRGRRYHTDHNGVEAGIMLTTLVCKLVSYWP